MSHRVLQLLGPSAGGIRRHVATLDAHLPDLGWRSQVAGPSRVMEGVGRQDHEVPVPGGGDPRRWLAGLRALRRAAQGVDVIHAHGLKAGWLATALPGGPPVVLTVHNLVLEDKAERSFAALQRMESLLPGRVEASIAVSPEIARHFTGVRGSDRMSVIIPASPPPTPVRSRDQLRAELQLDAGASLVVTVARLEPQKAVADLLDAWVTVRAACPTAVLVVVGDGTLRTELELRAVDLGIDGSTRFLGRQDDGASWLAAADVVAMSSIWEGSPIVAAETLQLGTPLVATVVGDLAEVVRDGVTGRLVPPRAPDRLAAAIIDQLGDLDGARAMARAAQPAALARYGTATLVAAVADRYDHVLQEHP